MRFFGLEAAPGETHNLLDAAAIGGPLLGLEVSHLAVPWRRRGIGTGLYE